VPRMSWSAHGHRPPAPRPARRYRRAKRRVGRRNRRHMFGDMDRYRIMSRASPMDAIVSRSKSNLGSATMPTTFCRSIRPRIPLFPAAHSAHYPSAPAPPSRGA
jgi:hypothetical protein